MSFEAGAAQLAQELEPDVVTMDILMPELNGIEATRVIVTENPEVRVLGVCMKNDRRFVEALLETGALGYILKENAAEELVKAGRAVARCGKSLGEGVQGEE